MAWSPTEAPLMTEAGGSDAMPDGGAPESWGGGGGGGVSDKLESGVPTPSEDEELMISQLDEKKKISMSSCSVH